MRPINQLAFLASLPILSIAAGGAKRPRGVGPEFAKFYQSETEFKCIFNPSITLKTSQVNDDYCDCPDGSDEPGTAACSFVSPLSPQQPLKSESHNTSLAIPGFYCKNRDYIPTYLPLSSVNNGVCEHDLCCDGSDEWAGVGGVRCDNKCSEMGKEWKRRQEIKETKLRNALKKRVQLVSEAKSLRLGVETKIKDLQREIVDLELKVVDLKNNYEQVKRKERGRMVRGGDSGKGGKITILANLVKIRIDQLRQALSQQVSKNEALQKRVNSIEKILSALKEDYNPNFNDEGVKRAVKAWEELVALKETDVDAEEEEEDLDIDGILQEDGEENGINWNEWQNNDDSDNSVLYKFEEYLPKPIRTWLDAKLVDLRVYLIDNGFLPSSSTEDIETKELQEAREAYESISNEINVKKSEKDEKQADLTKDYGKDEIFRSLEGHCIEKDSGEYTYELCWLKETKQKSKKNGMEIRMGTFASFDKVAVESNGVESAEDIQDSLNLSSDSVNEQLTLKYENGQNCWNGPSRETLVVLSCADENIIRKINEFEKCKYRLDVGSPAACEIISKKKN